MLNSVFLATSDEGKARQAYLLVAVQPALLAVVIATRPAAQDAVIATLLADIALVIFEVRIIVEIEIFDAPHAGKGVVRSFLFRLVTRSKIQSLVQGLKSPFARTDGAHTADGIFASPSAQRAAALMETERKNEEDDNHRAASDHR